MYGILLAFKDYKVTLGIWNSPWTSNHGLNNFIRFFNNYNFKECLRNGITPFIISDDIKQYYYRGLNEWKNEPGYLMDTCLTAQDRFKEYMDYFGLEYTD